MTTRLFTGHQAVSQGYIEIGQDESQADRMLSFAYKRFEGRVPE